MTEDEAIKELNKRIELIEKDYKVEAKEYKEVLETAAKALTEIQQYRTIGTADEIEPYVRLAEKLNLCDLVRENAKLAKKIQFLETHEKELKKYKEIGTVKECQEARERQKPKIPNIWGDGYGDNGNMIYDMYDCPNCGKSYEIDYHNYKYCPECGQAIDRSDLDKLV